MTEKTPRERLESLFKTNKPIIGMVHLAGDSPGERVGRALRDILIYEMEGVNGALIENYYGNVDDVERVLAEASIEERDIVFGVNVLPNEFHKSFPLAEKYGAGFIQLDYIAGKYVGGHELDVEFYNGLRGAFLDTMVFGGVWPKYYEQVKSSDLEQDIKDAKERADVVVVTGEGTGKETPSHQVRLFRRLLGEEHPLFVGAGMTAENAFIQLPKADGAIVGTSFKYGGETSNPVDEEKVRTFMDAVDKIRKQKRG